MVAVTQASPGELRRLVLVRTTPTVRTAAARVPVATYRRRRVVAAALVVGFLVAVAVLAHALVAPARASGPADGIRADSQAGVHVVQPGDTFWGIATALRPNDDPRPLVARLIAAHGSPILVVGERIPLPAA
jgi:hypothetical protein